MYIRSISLSFVYFITQSQKCS